MNLITLYQTESDWCALVEHNERRLTLTYVAEPNEAQVLADADKIVNPALLEVTTEDGTVLTLPEVRALDLTLTPAQKSAIRDAFQTINILLTKLGDKLPDDHYLRMLIRAHSPLLDALLSIAERLR